MVKKALAATVKKKPAPKKQILKKPERSWLVKYRALVIKRRFGKTYALIAVTVLLATTLFWSLLSARLHQSNADQLVNPYMFENANTFRGSLLPGQHTQLLKWPLFMLVQMFDYTHASFVAMTVLTTLLTVGLFAALLYYIERRPLMFGTLCLALASVLLLIPANPYSGGLLPVNMAMLTTRNIEYIIFVASLGLLARAIHIKTLSFWAGASLLALLAASDKLFLAISAGGALMALVIYALAKGWNLVNASAVWLMGSVAGLFGGLGIVWLVTRGGLLHIISGTSFGPYGLYVNAREIALGTVYGASGLLTNFGANPAFDATTLRSFMDRTAAHLFSAGGIGYIMNAGIFLAGLLICSRVMKASLDSNRDAKQALDVSAKLSVMLIWSSLAAIFLFIVTNHYYAVDARYLAITCFTVFVTAAAYLRRKHWPPENVVLVGTVLLISILPSTSLTQHINHEQQAALETMEARNTLVAQALDKRPVDVLVGDYWRVLPTKQAANGKLNVLPLEACTRPRGVLSSTAWQTDLNKHSFAYLLTIDKGLTDFPGCSLEQVLNEYGRPNASVLIAGTLDKPSELLLFYDSGAHKNETAKALNATVTPIPFEELPFSSCNAPTILNIVAHQDDDLLFMNPDLQNDYKAGHCVRTVYVTAGDAGGGPFYWLGREKGSEMAYSYMAGSSEIWVQRIVKLADNQFITVASPRGNAKLTLIFLHLPDGNVDGSGFQASGYESLRRLGQGEIDRIKTVDGQSTYSANQLETALASLMILYEPAEIRTQANFEGGYYHDHSDHMAVGRLVSRAYKRYSDQQFGGKVAIPIRFYTGYPVHEFEENVSGADLSEKEAIFLQYAQFDGGVCQDSQQCDQTSVYGAYLRRQYKNPE